MIYSSLSPFKTSLYNQKNNLLNQLNIRPKTLIGQTHNLMASLPNLRADSALLTLTKNKAPKLYFGASLPKINIIVNLSITDFLNV
jgi:hypothetical protein